MKLTADGFIFDAHGGWNVEVKYFHGWNLKKEEIYPGHNGHCAIIKREKKEANEILVFFDYIGKADRNDRDLFQVSGWDILDSDTVIDFPNFVLECRDEPEVPPSHMESVFHKYITKNIIPEIKTWYTIENEVKISIKDTKGNTTIKTFSSDGYDIIGDDDGNQRIVKPQGTGARVDVPKTWIGHRVLCIRLD